MNALTELAEHLQAQIHLCTRVIAEDNSHSEKAEATQRITKCRRWLKALKKQAASSAPSDPQEREALLAAQKLIREALPQFNWGASALNANAIRLLNEVPGIVNNALEKTP